MQSLRSFPRDLRKIFGARTSTRGVTKHDIYKRFTFVRTPHRNFFPAFAPGHYGSMDIDRRKRYVGVNYDVLKESGRSEMFSRGHEIE